MVISYLYSINPLARNVALLSKEDITVVIDISECRFIVKSFQTISPYHIGITGLAVLSIIAIWIEISGTVIVIICLYISRIGKEIGVLIKILNTAIIFLV